jgi:hypothetical protein
LPSLFKKGTLSVSPNVRRNTLGTKRTDVFVTGDVLRVVSWNVAYRVVLAGRQGEFLAALDPPPDLLLVQEAHPRSLDTIRQAVGLDWAVTGMGEEPFAAGPPLGGNRCSAILGRGDPASDTCGV